MADVASRSCRFVRQLPRSAHRLGGLLSSNGRQSSAVCRNRGRFYQLPTEILEGVFAQLDSPATIDQFSRTCKRCRAVSRQPSSIANWLLSRYGPRFALYYAILAVPQRCTEELLRPLLRKGAHIPRYLLQVLAVVYGQEQAPGTDLTLFAVSAQRMPLSGYLTLLHEGTKLYGDTLRHHVGNDLVLFINALQMALTTSFSLPSSTSRAPSHEAMPDNTAHHDVWKTLIDTYAVIPVPIRTSFPFSLRPLLRLAERERAYFDKLAPIFEFDPLARRFLWEAILLFLFDIAFITSKQRKTEYQSRLAVLQHVISRREPSLVGSVQDADMFCDVVVSLLGKYPPGYCTRDTMANMLDLLITYVYPSFSIQEALISTFDNTHMRPDIRDGIAYFLCKKAHSTYSLSK